MLRLLDKGFKTAMIKKKYFNNYDHASNREKKPQPSLSKEIENIKNNQIEIWELKNITK